MIFERNLLRCVVAVRPDVVEMWRVLGYSTRDVVRS